MKKTLMIAAAIVGLGLYTTAMAQVTPVITEKQVNQQVRIQKGRQSGELTGKEVAGLEMREAKIQHDKRVAKSDGVVTPHERRKLRREQRRASKAIYRQKHDNQTRQ